MHFFSIRGVSLEELRRPLHFEKTIWGGGRGAEEEYRYDTVKCLKMGSVECSQLSAGSSCRWVGGWCLLAFELTAWHLHVHMHSYIYVFIHSFRAASKL